MHLTANIHTNTMFFIFFRKVFYYQQVLTYSNVLQNDTNVKLCKKL